MHAAFKSKQPGLTPSIALRNAAIVVFILALVIPDPALRILMLAAGALAAIVYIIRKSFRRGRRYGIAVLSIVLLTVGSISASQLLAYRTHTLLLEKLAKYDGATVRRYFFPIPYVHQLSIESGVDDRDLKAILEMPELTNLTELYLESNDLTDNCLSAVSRVKHLQYIFLDCDLMSDSAILAFEKQHPDCQVIPYQRNLHGDPGITLGYPRE